MEWERMKCNKTVRARIIDIKLWEEGGGNWKKWKEIEKSEKK